MRLVAFTSLLNTFLGGGNVFLNGATTLLNEKILGFSAGGPSATPINGSYGEKNAFLDNLVASMTIPELGTKLHLTPKPLG